MRKLPRFYSVLAEPPRMWRTAADLAILAALTAAMVALRAHAPSSTHRYAQAWQIRASLDHLRGGSLILPRIDSPDPLQPERRDFARKPQMYAWLTTAAIQLTGWRNEFVYRVPTILSAWGVAVLTYLLARRWYSRRAGLLAGVFWLTLLNMSKLIYLATTDMLLAWWITLSVFCADRVLFHPVRRRRVWAAAFWLAMLAAALTKGWGIVNLAVLGLFVALASAWGPGFAALRKGRGGKKVALLLRMLARRWRAAAGRIGLPAGLLLLAAVSVPLWWTMFRIGGETFRGKAYFEVVQRITGEGEHAPHRVSGPALLHLYYDTLPASIFAGCAFFLVPFRRWLHHRSPIALPVCWIVAVLLAFTIPAGFRPDYLLPCYPAVALLAAWAAEELARPERYDIGTAKQLRRVGQATAFFLAAAMTLVPAASLAAERLGRTVWGLTIPSHAVPGTRGLLAATAAAGAASLAMGVWSVRRRRLDAAACLACAGMVGISVLYTHLWSRDARTGDGETMLQFARNMQRVVGEEEFAVYNAQKLCTEVHLGRFGSWLTASPEKVLSYLGSGKVRWLITSDYGLVALGAYQADPAGDVAYRNDQTGQTLRCHARPADLGTPRVVSARPVKFEKWGRMYLIEITRPPRPSSPPFDPGYISDPVR